MSYTRISIDDLFAAQELSIRDLIVALGWQLDAEHLNNDLSAYWALRLRLLSDALGLPPDWRDDRTRTPFIIEVLARAARRPGVFGGVLEYSPGPYVSGMGPM